jgi:hypothetical protein
MEDEMDGNYNRITDNHSGGNEFRATIIPKILVEVTKLFNSNEVRLSGGK